VMSAKLVAVLDIRVGKAVHGSPELVVGRIEGHGVLGLNLVEPELQQHGMVGTEGWVPGRGVQWVMIGNRGLQRRVYAKWLSKLLEVPHISMGSLVRQELHPHSSLYK
jgi:hypothetical protein